MSVRGDERADFVPGQIYRSRFCDGLLMMIIVAITRDAAGRGKQLSMLWIKSDEHRPRASDRSEQWSLCAHEWTPECWIAADDGDGEEELAR